MKKILTLILLLSIYQNAYSSKSKKEKRKIKKIERRAQAALKETQSQNLTLTKDECQGLCAACTAVTPIFLISFLISAKCWCNYLQSQNRF